MQYRFIGLRLWEVENIRILIAKLGVGMELWIME